MADATPINSFPYLESTDDPDIAGGLQDLAEAVETTVEELRGKGPDRPLCRLVQQSAQTGIASLSTAVLTFGTSSEAIDTHNMHSETTNNTRITPNKAGYYRVVVQPIISFNGNITGALSVIFKNGTAVMRSGNHRPNVTGINCAAMPAEGWFYANGTTDYFEAGVTASTSSGTWGTNAVAESQSTFLVEYMGDL